MYTCHLSVLRRSLVEEVGGFDPESRGLPGLGPGAEGDRAGAGGPARAARSSTTGGCCETSAAGGGEEAKPWAFEAGARAVQAHCERIGLRARVERDPADPGVYHLQPALREQPPVSIVIPTAGTSREVRYETVVLVEHCLRSIVETSTYENYEIVVVPDEAVDPAVLAELGEIAGERLRIVPYERAVQLLGEDRPRRRPQRGRAPAAAQRRHRGRHPGLDRAHGHVLRRWRTSAPSAARLIWEDGRLQHVGVELRRRPAGPPLPRLRRRLPRLLEQRPHRPQLPRRDRRLPDDAARGLRGAGRLHHRAPGQLQRRRLLPEGARERAADRLRPRPGDVPLRVVQPLLRGRGVGEGMATEALAADASAKTPTRTPT